MKTLGINISNNSSHFFSDEVMLPISDKAYERKKVELRKMIEDEFVKEVLFSTKSKEEIKELLNKKVREFFKKDIRLEKLKTLKMKDKLEKAYIKNNTSAFVSKDPIQIPRRFTKKEDIEISGFLAATLAFGKRQIIINKCNDFLNRMDNKPYEYVMNGDYSSMKGFVHRTINDVDFIYYLTSLKNIYENGGLEKLFSDDIEKSLINFWQVFFALDHEKRSERHISNIKNKSAGKRLNLFLRWMVRKDNVDLGIWKSIKPSSLYIPLDVHVGNITRELGIITRKQNDWKSVCEITSHLKDLDPNDPIKYDLSLFSLDL